MKFSYRLCQRKVKASSLSLRKTFGPTVQFALSSLLPVNYNQGTLVITKQVSFYFAYSTFRFVMKQKTSANIGTWQLNQGFYVNGGLKNRAGHGWTIHRPEYVNNLFLEP